jgi:hypothetical protein
MSFNEDILKLVSCEIDACGENPARHYEVLNCLSAALALIILHCSKDRARRISVAMNTCNGIVDTIEKRA